MVYGLWSKRGLTLVELVIALVLIGLFTGVFAVLIQKASIVGKERGVVVDLKSIRQSLLLYEALNGRYPEDLRELVNASVRAESSADEVFFGEEFLGTVGRDKMGYPVDTFGNRFTYNTDTGAVSSSTEGYENW